MKSRGTKKKIKARLMRPGDAGITQRRKNLVNLKGALFVEALFLVNKGAPFAKSLQTQKKAAGFLCAVAQNTEGCA